jgi:hypothetical protein
MMQGMCQYGASICKCRIIWKNGTTLKAIGGAGVYSTNRQVPKICTHTYVHMNYVHMNYVHMN